MRLLVLLALPLLAAGAAWFTKAERRHAALLPSVAAIHAALVVSCWVWPAFPAPGGWLALDAAGLLILTLSSATFLATAIYAVGYVRRETPRGGRVFASCLLAFLAAMTLVSISQHLALLWLGMEGAALSMAPLVYHRHDRRSLSAVWKYLLMSSVGIALALLGVYFLATAQSGSAGRPLLLSDLAAAGAALRVPWLRAAFLFLLAGFGTKMGLAPMHTWKPDTYGEAPPLVGGLMAGVLTAGAFLGIVRITQVMIAAGEGGFARPLLIAFGILSLIVAAAFIAGQRDLKRLLAYSSVEHMGLLALGLGLGGIGAYGSVLHVLNNGVAKTLLFLTAGNAILHSSSATSADNRGLLRRLPLSGALLFIGLLAIGGSPPFGVFFSELTIVGAAVNGGHAGIAAIVLAILAIIFIAVAAILLDVVFAPAPAAEPAGRRMRESAWLVTPPLALAVIALVLGVWIPHPVRALLARAAITLGGHAP